MEKSCNNDMNVTLELNRPSDLELQTPQTSKNIQIFGGCGVDEMMYVVKVVEVCS